jgi:2-dehydro-3-deoxyglucarate aldolase/4-hydroxy-2-oxoheptanedioate aldolase
LFFAQIESTKAVANVDSIAGVDGIDVLFVGPADLKLSLSTEPAVPSFDAALNNIVTAAKTHDKHAGILICDTKDTATLLNQGFTKIAVDSYMSLLRAGFLAIRPKP